MKKLILGCMLVSGIIYSAQCQKYFTKSGTINFIGKTSLETIDGTSNQVTSLIDIATGDIVFKVLQTSFQFKQALMQEHYNEKYMESEKYPNASFKGKITNLGDVNFKKDGTYNVKVSGELEMHGVSNKVTVDGTVTVNGGNITAQAKFPVTEKDYKIEIPAAVKNKIADTINVTANMSYSLYGK